VVSFLFKENPSGPSRRSGALAAQADAARHLPLKRGGKVWCLPYPGIKDRRVTVPAELWFDRLTMTDFFLPYAGINVYQG